VRNSYLSTVAFSTRRSLGFVVSPIAFAVCSTILNSQLPGAAGVATIVVVAVALRRVLPAVAAMLASTIVVTCFWLCILVFGGRVPEIAITSQIGSLLLLVFPGALAVAFLAKPGPAQSSFQTRLRFSLGRLVWRPMLREWRALVAIVSGTVVVISCTAVAYTKFGTASFAWALGGDARNHVIVANKISHLGGLPPDLLSYYPAFPNALLALSDQSSRFLIPSSQTSLEHLVLSLGTIYVLAICGWSFLGAAIVWKLVSTTGNHSLVGIAAASLAPLTGVGIGVALRDGYYSAVVTIVFSLATLGLIALAENSSSLRERGWALGIASLGIPVVAACWTPLAVPIAAAWVFIAFRSLRHLTREVSRWIWTVAFLSACVTAMVVVPLIRYSLRTGKVTSAGAITPPSPDMILAFVAIACAFAIITQKTPRPAWHPPAFVVASVVALVIVVAAMAAQPTTDAWAYYPAKLAWAWACIALPLAAGVLSCAAGPLSKSSRCAGGTKMNHRSHSVKRFCVFTLLGVGSLFLLQGSSSIPSPFLTFDLLKHQAASPIADGWNAPSASTMNLVFQVSKEPGSSVLWDSIDPSNDRLGNFWLSLSDNQRYNTADWYLSPFAQWAYVEVPGDTNSLCELLMQEPGRQLIAPDGTRQSFTGC
jgi:hypothetical protein